MKLIKSILALCFLALFSLNVSAALVDINTADAKTLEKVMVGIGPKKAAAIVVYRDMHGPFASIHSLAKIKGIGRKTIERNQDKIMVAPAAEDPGSLKE